MRTPLLTCLALSLPLIAAESPRVFPLWDGKETVERYAARVNLSPTKSVDLGGGVKMELVLIPAGSFIMGSAEPEKPRVTVAASQILIAIGSALAFALVATHWKSREGKKKLVFSLRGLMAFAIACGLIAGGIARHAVALKEAARYEAGMAEYSTLPANEKPAHSVTIAQPFYMGKYTVTQEQYEAVAGAKSGGSVPAQFPVGDISWDDAEDFCEKLNECDPALNARLPTETQWEFACRAGSRTRFHSGDQESDLNAVAWYNMNSGRAFHPVGTKRANAFGLYDLHGNVMQWCRDVWMDRYDGSSSVRQTFRAMRGGWQQSPLNYCRSASREGHEQNFRTDCLGFRIVIALEF